MLLTDPGVIGAAVLLSAMVPFSDPPDADLSGTVVVISNGDRDPTIPPGMTTDLAAQFRDRRADVVELPHRGGHQIDPAVLPQIASIISRPERQVGPHIVDA